MQRVKIITDSASDLPLEYFEKYNVSMLPMGIAMGERTYLDRAELTSQAFFEMMRQNPERMPTTVMPSVEVIGNEFMKNLKDYEHQIYICISSKGSGTYNVAQMVKNEIEERSGAPSNITVVDSLSFSAGYGLTVSKIAKSAFEGADFETVMRQYRESMENTQVFLVVDDLKHLQRGGRINPSVALVGSVLGIKPILTIRDGIIDSFGKERGKRRSMERLAKLVSDSAAGRQVRLWVVHTDAHEDAMTLGQMISQQISPVQTQVIELGACIGTHTGRGLLGVVFRTEG